MSEIIQSQPDDLNLSDLEGHSEKEKQEILHEIDQITEQNRLTVTDELFKITPLKKGGTLPLVINILGIIAIVTSFYFTSQYFQEQEQTMATNESSYKSTEGSVIEELKRQAEEKLNKKQAEISQIQNELSKLDRESAALRENMDSRIKDKELELRSEMEEALAKERARLQSQNISTLDLEKQLREFQDARESVFNADIEIFKNESALAIKAKEEELAKARQIANDILEQANRDKVAIEAETLKREAELTKQFEEEREALTKQTTEATKKLAELSQLQKNEQLIQDQITGSYNSIIKSIDEGNYLEAKTGIEAVRTLLNDPQISDLPSINKRKNIELYFLDSMEKEIQQAGVITTTDFTSMTRAAEALLSARQSAQYGTDAEKEGSQYDAKRFYNEALSTLPQISKAVENLNVIEANDRTSISREYLDLGNNAMNEGKLNEAIKQFRAAALRTAPENTESITKAIAGIETALKRENEIHKARLEKAISELNSKLETKETDIKELAIDYTSLENSNIELENSILNLESEKRILEKAVADAEKNQEELINRMKDLSKQVDESEVTINELNSKILKSAQTIEELNVEIRKTTYTIEALTKKAARATSRAEDLENELNDAVNQIVDLIN